MEAPGDGHGAFALVVLVGGGAEEGVGGGDAALVLLAAADEEQDVAAALGVLAVAATGRGVLAGGARARPSHQLSAAASDAPSPAVFSRLGVLNVLSSTPASPSDRKPHWARHLAALATTPGEICGLVSAWDADLLAEQSYYIII